MSGDPLHPFGRCRCCGEGTCEWCVSIENAECPVTLGDLRDMLAVVLAPNPDCPCAHCAHLRASTLTDPESPGSIGSAQTSLLGTAPTPGEQRE